MDETATKLLESKIPDFLGLFKEEIIGISHFREDLEVAIKPEQIGEIIKYLKEGPSSRFEMMMDLFGMDYLSFNPPTSERFAVIYILYSLTRKERVRLKVFLPELNPRIDSIYDLYKAANWFEREAWDLYGIQFAGHPNLVRILCHQDFVGHPLRKDYPSDGYQRLKHPAPSTGI